MCEGEGGGLEMCVYTLAHFHRIDHSRVSSYFQPTVWELGLAFGGDR